MHNFSDWHAWISFKLGLMLSGLGWIASRTEVSDWMGFVSMALGIFILGLRAVQEWRKTFPAKKEPEHENS